MKILPLIIEAAKTKPFVDPDFVKTKEFFSFTDQIKWLTSTRRKLDDNMFRHRRLLRPLLQASGITWAAPSDPPTKPGFTKTEMPKHLSMSDYWIPDTSPILPRIQKLIKHARRESAILEILRRKIIVLKRNNTRATRNQP